jgi:hypothetical protein
MPAAQERQPRWDFVVFCAFFLDELATKPLAAHTNHRYEQRVRALNQHLVFNLTKKVIAKFSTEFFEDWAYTWWLSGHWAYRHWALGILGLGKN